MPHQSVSLTVTGAIALCFVASASAAKLEAPSPVSTTVEQACFDCHKGSDAEAGLDLAALKYDLEDSENRERWIRIHDRVEAGEMPPDAETLSAMRRSAFLNALRLQLHESDAAEVVTLGRGPMRRLNRDEYQQNLRDALKLPALDIRDILPEDRESHLFNKTSEALDISRVQLNAYLDAAEAALLQAVASGVDRPPITKFHAVGRKLFESTATFGNREAMFFAKDSKAVDNKELNETPSDPTIEVAVFRSAHWPYYGYPQSFTASLPGEYRVSFSARAVKQLPGFELRPAMHCIPMTFRARKRSGADVSGDVRATGGLIDIQPDRAEYETVVRLKATETLEYSLLGLPVPLARNVDGGPPTYRYPPFPDDGQPGVAFQSLTIEGPLSPSEWPPLSHRVLFGDLPIRESRSNTLLPIEVICENPSVDAKRLLRAFVDQVARQPIPDETIATYEQLILSRLAKGANFAEAMLTGYKAFLCSGHMLYLHEPIASDDGRRSESDVQYAIASRLSHFLTNTRPDETLINNASSKLLRDSTVLHDETDRLIATDDFDRFVTNFTDYWIDLRNIHRDEPNIILYPEYRFDNYLVESMERETRAFFTVMIRENLPINVLIDANFVIVNDRLSQHYGLPLVEGSAMRKAQLPEGSAYGGLLTQASILKVTSNGTATSPVVRGAWVMERLIGEPPPPPPASVPAVEPDIRGATTVRELLALHTTDTSCANCHARFDPVGVALENFDIFGSWRDRYRGLGEGDKISGIDRAGHDFVFAMTSAVDASGALRDGRAFQDIHDLKRLLAGSPRQLAKNLLHQLTIYATGTPVRFSDRAEIEAILDVCKESGYRSRDLLHGLVQSKIFLGPDGSVASHE